MKIGQRVTDVRSGVSGECVGVTEYFVRMKSTEGITTIPMHSAKLFRNGTPGRRPPPRKCTVATCKEYVHSRMAGPATNIAAGAICEEHAGIAINCGFEIRRYSRDG